MKFFKHQEIDMDISLPSDLSEFVKMQVESGAYLSESAVLTEAVKLLKNRTPVPTTNGHEKTVQPLESKPIWQVFQEIQESVPDEEWAKLPTDLSTQHDHYLYGAPKRPE
jgi:Arc/MetJ-type ribon-helix-helix transcriptional regulator